MNQFTTYKGHRIPTILPFLAICVFAHYVAKEVVGDSTIVLALIAAVVLSIVCFKKPTLALSLLIVIATSVFDAVPLDKISFIDLPVVGKQVAYQLLLFLLVLYSLKVLVNRNVSIKSSITYPIIALLLLTGGEVVRSLMEGNDPHFIMDRAKTMLFYLVFFLAMDVFQTREKLASFMKQLVFIAVVSAGVNYIIIFTGLELAPITKYHLEYGYYQPIPLSLYLMCAVFLSVFAFWLQAIKEKRSAFWYSVLLLWIGVLLLLILIRSVWIGTIVSMIVVLALSKVKIPKVLYLVIVLILFGSFLFPMMESSSIVVQKARLGYSDVVHGTGSFGYRMESMSLRWNYMIEHNPFFGAGFKGSMFDREFNLSQIYDPTMAEGDNMLAFIFARYGLSGLMVFVWLLYAVFKKIFYLLRVLSQPWERTLVYGILAFNLQIVLVSYSAALYSQDWAIVILAPSWATLEFLERTNKHRVASL